MMHKVHSLGHQEARFPELDQERFASQRCGDSFEISRGLDGSSCLVERSPQEGNGYCWLRRTDGNTSDKYAYKYLTPQFRRVCAYIIIQRDM